MTGTQWWQGELPTENYNLNIIKPPEQSEWEALLTPDGKMKFIPYKGGHPNWFHRKMQQLCFGIRWQKRDSI